MHSKGLVQTMTWMLVLATVAAMTPATLASTGNDSTRERDQQSAGQDAITRSPEPLRPTVALTLDAPPVAAPGEIVTATLVLENAGSSQEPISAVTTSALPRGVEFVAAEVGVIWDSYLNTVYWEVESLVPGETAVAQFSVRVTAVGPAVYVTLTAGAQASAVAELITDEALVQILPSQAAQTHLDPGRPGELRVDGGRFRAAVDGAGNPHGVTLTHRWQQPQPGQFYAFDFTLDRTAPVTAPLTITLHYNPSDLSSAPPAQLTFRRLACRGCSEGVRLHSRRACSQ